MNPVSIAFIIIPYLNILSNFYTGLKTILKILIKTPKNINPTTINTIEPERKRKLLEVSYLRNYSKSAILLYEDKGLK